MKYLKKFLEITEYKYIETFEEDENVLDDIKDLLLEIEDMGYENRIWLNDYYAEQSKKEKVTKIEIESNKDKKVSKEDFEIIIEHLKRLNDYLQSTDFRIKKIELYDFSKVSTSTDIISLDNTIETYLDNVNTYYVLIDRLID